MSLLPISGSEPSQPVDKPNEELDIRGIDATIHTLTLIFVKPQEEPGAEKKLVAIKLDDGTEAYVNIDDVSKATGIAKDVLASQSRDELTELLNRQDELLSGIDRVIDTVKGRFPKIEQHSANLAKFMVHQLKGREDPPKALGKLEAIVRREEILRAAIYAGRSGATYVGKRKGKHPSSSLLTHDGQIYVGGSNLGKGGSSKVSELESLSGNPFSGVKAVARGKKTANLARHLAMTEKLNQLGVPHITPTHLVKVLTKTKAGEAKLVALVNKMDGDAFKFTDLKISTRHVCYVLICVCEALASMHQLAEPMVHGDVKPENILLKGDTTLPFTVDEEGNAEIVEGILHDFGGTDVRGKPIQDRTREFLAPEVLKDAVRTLEPEQDLFSLGVAALEMTTARNTLANGRFFGEAKDQTEITKHLEDLQQRLINGDIGKGLSPIDKYMRFQLVALAGKLMQIDPKSRLSADQAAEEFAQIMRESVQVEKTEQSQPGYLDQLLQSLT